MDVKRTNDYSKFKKIKGNRPVSDSHLKDLIASISENNLLQYTPILVNKQFEVIDGQHRLEAAKKIKAPIYYVQIDNGDLSDVLLINANLRKWTLLDYLESNILLGKTDYKVLKEYLARYEFPVGVSIKLLSGWGAQEGTHAGRKSPMRDFRLGDFKVTHLKDATQMGDRLHEIKPFVEGTTWKDSAFIDALAIVYTKVKPRQLLEALRNRGAKLNKRVRVRDYLIDLEDLYNYRKSSGRVTFYG